MMLAEHILSKRTFGMERFRQLSPYFIVGRQRDGSLRQEHHFLVDLNQGGYKPPSEFISKSISSIR